MATNEPKPRFEPPPWEQEAFERFRREQEEARKQNVPEWPAAARQEPEAVRQEPEVAMRQEASAAEQEEPTGAAADGTAAARVPEAQVAEMLLRLRDEEPPAAPTNMVVVNVVSALLGVAGLAIAIESFVLFVRTGKNDTVAMLVVAIMSFIMLAVGGALVAGAVMLFRKYHR